MNTKKIIVEDIKIINYNYNYNPSIVTKEQSKKRIKRIGSTTIEHSKPEQEDKRVRFIISIEDGFDNNVDDLIDEDELVVFRGLSSVIDCMYYIDNNTESEMLSTNETTYFIDQLIIKVDEMINTLTSTDGFPKMSIKDNNNSKGNQLNQDSLKIEYL